MIFKYQASKIFNLVIDWLLGKANYKISIISNIQNIIIIDVKEKLLRII